MGSSAGLQRNGVATGNSFDERFDNLRGYPHPSSGQKRNSMDSITQYQPTPQTIQQTKPQDTRRPMLPTSVVAAYAASSPTQRMPPHPTHPEQGIQRHNSIVPGPPGHSFTPFKGPENHENHPPERTYGDGPQLNFKYDNATQDPNQPRGQQQHHGRPLTVSHQHHTHPDQPQPNPLIIPSVPQRPPPSATSSPIALQTPAPVTLRKPNASQSQPVHSDVVKAAAKALTPIQHLYEEAWGRTVSNVQHEISRMHSELMRLLDAERRQNQMMRVERDAVFEEANRLRAENAEMREDVKRAAAEVQRVRLDRDEQLVEFRRLQANNEVLHRQGQAQMLRVQAGEQAQKDAMHSTVETMRAELEKQFEIEMEAKTKELQEQRSLRALAEKRLAEATQKLKGITDGLLSASQFCSEQERQSSESATIIGSPEMEIAKLKVEDDPGRGHTPTARGDRTVGSRPPSRTTSISPLAQMSPPHVKQEPLSMRQATPHAHSRTSSRAQSPHPLRSPHSLYLHISETPQDHHGTHNSSDHAPTPCSTTSDDRPRGKGRDESPASSATPKLGASQQQPCPVVPASPVPPSPIQSDRRPLLHHSPVSEIPGHRSVPAQNSQPSPPQAFPSRPDYHKSPPLPGSNNQHSRPTTTTHTPSSPSRLAATPPARFTAPLPPVQGSSDQRKRKRGRTEFEHDAAQRWAGEYRRLAPNRSVTDPTSDRERSRPRPKLDESRSNSQVETVPKNTSASNVEKSPKVPVASSSTGTGPVDEGEVLVVSKFDAGETHTVSVGADPKSQSEKEKPAVVRPRLNKIGINHMDLLYETRGEEMICRMCRNRPKDKEKLTPPMTFSTKASWPELVGHCKTGHPKDWGELERLSPSQIGELRQRMASSNFSGFTLR